MKNEKTQATRGPEIVNRTFEFATAMVKLVIRIERESFVSRTLARQVLRSATSIGANMEEAQAAESKPDFIHKCRVALKEARETNYWLRLLKASKITDHKDLDDLTRESDEIARVIAKIVINTKNQQKQAKA